ncbi:2-hydroxychromene-2-carboxylate isomerase [Phenylobacterium aquaticum]|uniref:2-hydroxychromene-2-carboxylate isomerase n=1 Tax=Phenylobacterium aquaticum TaxID=1763816 RepID=UPI001F5D653F|nr:DsbA family protein [Phenylobacterium aquaticum]MCI3135623.1 DsbA family protein [Phenylobacterium aquaticum]
MSLSVDVFWSFRSPYSYLVTSKLRALQEDFDVTVNMRPVYPLAVRSEGFFTKADPLFIPYLMRDIRRLAEFHGLPLQWPRPDPVVINRETLNGAPEQPHLDLLMPLGVVAGHKPEGVAFYDEVSRLIWSGEDMPWNEGDKLQRAIARAGLDMATLQAEADAAGDAIAAEIEANQEAHRASGHWGVPTMVFEGEPFFGQDRFDLLVWRLKQHGLTARG